LIFLSKDILGYFSLVDIRLGEFIFIDSIKFFAEGFELRTDRRYKIRGFGFFDNKLFSIMTGKFLF
jgi:hypothetical protein